MRLATRTFTQYVQDMAAAIQGGASQVLDLSVGSVIRTLLEAQASVALWLQVLIADVLDASRAGTARGNALDTWMADFALFRLPATYATGYATFSRNSDIGAVEILPQTSVRSSSGDLTFLVVRDASHGHWVPEIDGYLLPVGQQSVALPIRAVVPGSIGNVGAGSITMMTSSVAGLDAVENVQPTSGGMDAESDEALRKRFIDYINSRSKATSDAISYAIRSSRQGLRFRIQENQDSDGSFRPGHFVVVIDDGTRAPTQELLRLVSKQIDLVRPIGASFAVSGPIVRTCDITCSISLTVTDTVIGNQIKAAVAQSIRQFVMSLEISETLPTTRVAQIVYASDPRISNVVNIRINGQVDDLVPGPRGAIVPQLIAVS